ncbi:HAD family hydrolase [Vibrio algicola]|uniref:HAD-IB family hydrolase n=1 Tax=Vibrio algicola TaxID=2662262 RepID=A0A5Q0TIW6_9VIBR|nr:HAD family hydrolase [Vibrio algicola]
MPNSLIVFDMDETLINADCAMLWHEFLVEQGIATQPGFITEDKRLMALYAKGELDMQQYLAFSIQPISHLSVQQVSQLADQCVEEKILPLLFPQAKILIEQLHQRQQVMLIISASVSFLVTAVAKRIDIPHAIGIDLVEQQGRFTATILGTPTYQQGKVTRLQQWCQQHHETFSAVHFYTDSINDLPLCQYADFAYLVNPCERLEKQAQGKPWQILHWG